MSDDFSFTIKIPCDEDGFVLLQCPQCGEFFKLRPNDYESDDVLEVCCPACGIVSDSYLTEDVVDLAMTIAKNKAFEAIRKEMKKLERQTKGKAVSFKAGRPPRPDDEPVLQPSIDALAITTCRHCGMQSKVSRLLSMSMYVCPLCGVSNLMIDKTDFKKTLYRFNHEANILLRSNWEESPAPFKRFLDRIEGEPVIKEYLDNCVNNHTPEGFGADEDVREVAAQPGVTFINFSTIPEEESAEVYLILKAVIAQDIHGRSYFYYTFASGNKYPDMYKGFLDKVVWRLIANITEHLTMIGIEMGLDNSDSVTNNIGTVQNLQMNQAAGGSTINATQNNGINEAQLSDLLNAILTAAEDEIEDTESVEDVRDSVEIIRVQMESGEPKRGVLKGTLSVLHGVNGGVQFVVALAQIIEFINMSGFQFPLPG